MSSGAEIYLWGSKIGTVFQKDEHSIPRFNYDKNFVESGIQISPITMPLSEQVYSFPGLREETFHGLPGLLSDSLPDKFGTRIMDSYLAKLGRSENSLTAVERLCYVGSRGMGALEFIPQMGMGIPDQSIDIDELAELADKILSERKDIKIKADEQAMEQLIKVGTSAGGARAKALIAWNEKTRDIRSGQIDAGDGYGYWLLKFGTVLNNRDKDKEADSKEYSKIEFAYSLMAKDAGIKMSECRLLKSDEGMHFMTRRFDRELDSGRKIHMQSLGGLAHFDFNAPGVHSYEQAAEIVKRLGLPINDMEQIFRRLVFNEVAKNYDDHVKNVSFLMDRYGKWRLAPAYDMTFSYNPNSVWTSAHQMSINGKRESLTLADMKTCGLNMDLSERKVKKVLQEVIATVRAWERYAEYVGLSEVNMKYVKKFHRYSEEYRDYMADTKLLNGLQENKCSAYVEF